MSREFPFSHSPPGVTAADFDRHMGFTTAAEDDARMESEHFQATHCVECEALLSDEMLELGEDRCDPCGTAHWDRVKGRLVEVQVSLVAGRVVVDVTDEDSLILHEVGRCAGPNVCDHCPDVLEDN